MTEQERSPALDIARIVAVLDHHEVAYVLVGGVAAGLYGAVRLTEDFDCVASRTRENLRRLGAAMSELRARLRVEGLSDAEAAALPIRLEPEVFASMELSTWRTDAGDLDVLAGLPAIDGRLRPYDALVQQATNIRVAGVVVHVAGLDDIINSKRWANRPKDLDAIPELEALVREQIEGPERPGL